MPHTSYYTVNTFIDGEFIACSDVFRSRRRAQALVDHMTSIFGFGIDNNVEYVVFKSRPLPPKVYLDQDDEDTVTADEPSTSSMPSLVGMTFEDYGKGYILRAPRSSQYYGDKYFLDGWWNAGQKGWFFKREFFDELMSLGAEYIVDAASGKSKRATRSSRQTQPSSMTVSTRTTRSGRTNRKVTFDFSGMTFEEFGKGFLLRASEDHPLFGEKYLLSGFWNAKQEGWFFRRQFESELVDHGAQFIDPTADDSDDDYDPEVVTAASALTSMDLSSMYVEEYGRGYILVPPADHPNFGDKYFREGWWRPDLSAWFFRSQFLDGLIADGAVLVQVDV